MVTSSHSSRWTAALVASVVLAGCGAREEIVSHSPTTPAGSSTVDTILDAASRPTRLDQVARLSGDDLAVAFSARERLVESCMAGAGFEYRRATLVPPPDQSARALYPAAELVERYGYGWRAHRILVDGSQGSTAGAVPGPVNECGARASDELGWSELTRVQQDFANAQADIDRVASSSSGVAEALVRWVACMAAEGRDFASPDDAEAAANAMPDGPSSTEAIGLAVADFGCRRAAALEEATASARADAVAEWIAAHPDLMQRLDTARANLVSAARSAP